MANFGQRCRHPRHITHLSLTQPGFLSRIPPSLHRGSIPCLDAGVQVVKRHPKLFGNAPCQIPAVAGSRKIKYHGGFLVFAFFQMSVCPVNWKLSAIKYLQQILLSTDSPVQACRYWNYALLLLSTSKEFSYCDAMLCCTVYTNPRDLVYRTSIMQST